MGNYKSGFVAIIGRPNVGKSTLMNRIIRQKIAITSHKPQTTRNKIQTVYTDDEAQLIFVDTPGIMRPKNKLGEYMVGAANSAVADVDLVLLLVEASKHIGAGDRDIIERLRGSDIPVMLVINKVDKVSREDVFASIETYRHEFEFAEIVPISAIKGSNVDELITCIKGYMPEGVPFYDEDTVTDQPERAIVSELIREKLLRIIQDEIPHGVAVLIEAMEYKRNICHIDAMIICEKDSHKGIIIGKGGGMLKEIGQKARIDIEKLIDIKVNLQLRVKVKKDWRDSDYLIRNFGYESKK